MCVCYYFHVDQKLWRTCFIPLCTKIPLYVVNIHDVCAICRQAMPPLPPQPLPTRARSVNAITYLSTPTIPRSISLSYPMPCLHWLIHLFQLIVDGRGPSDGPRGCTCSHRYCYRYDCVAWDELVWLELIVGFKVTVSPAVTNVVWGNRYDFVCWCVFHV